MKTYQFYADVKKHQRLGSNVYLLTLTSGVYTPPDLPRCICAFIFTVPKHVDFNINTFKWPKSLLTKTLSDVNKPSFIYIQCTLLCITAFTASTQLRKSRLCPLGGGSGAVIQLGGPVWVFSQMLRTGLR